MESHAKIVPAVGSPSRCRRYARVLAAKCFLFEDRGKMRASRRGRYKAFEILVEQRCQSIARCSADTAETYRLARCLVAKIALSCRREHMSRMHGVHGLQRNMMSQRCTCVALFYLPMPKYRGVTKIRYFRPRPYIAAVPSIQLRNSNSSETGPCQKYVSCNVQ